MYKPSTADHLSNIIHLLLSHLPPLWVFEFYSLHLLCQKSPNSFCLKNLSSSKLTFKLVWILSCCFSFDDFNSLENILQILFYFIQKLSMFFELNICFLQMNLRKSVTVNQHFICLLKPLKPVGVKIRTGFKKILKLTTTILLHLFLCSNDVFYVMLVCESCTTLNKHFSWSKI